jgi:hypothetical protein
MIGHLSKNIRQTTRLPSKPVLSYEPGKRTRQANPAHEPGKQTQDANKAGRAPSRVNPRQIAAARASPDVAGEYAVYMMAETGRVCAGRRPGIAINALWNWPFWAFAAI